MLVLLERVSEDSWTENLPRVRNRSTWSESWDALETHEGNSPAGTAMAYQESETIASSDPGPSVVPAVPDLQQEEECPRLW